MVFIRLETGAFEGKGRGNLPLYPPRKWIAFVYIYLGILPIALFFLDGLAFVGGVFFALHIYIYIQIR